jgi:hypothetical protein
MSPDMQYRDLGRTGEDAVHSDLPPATEGTLRDEFFACGLDWLEAYHFKRLSDGVRSRL